MNMIRSFLIPFQCQKIRISYKSHNIMFFDSGGRCKFDKRKSLIFNKTCIHMRVIPNVPFQVKKDDISDTKICKTKLQDEFNEPIILVTITFFSQKKGKTSCVCCI